MTSELKPCPWCDAAAEHHRNERLARCSTPHCPAAYRLIDVDLWNTRPSPAPTVSVEECVKAFEKVRREHLYRSAWIDPNSLGELHAEAREKGIAAVHALCVSRLTGAATRSETIEECAKACDQEALDDEERASQYGNGSAEQVELLHMAEADRVCARLIRDLASHPASVAGEARPSVDVKALRSEMLNALANEWPMFRDASDEYESKRMDYDEAELFVREAFDIAVKKLGAALYERGAK